MVTVVLCFHRGAFLILHVKKGFSREAARCCRCKTSTLIVAGLCTQVTELTSDINHRRDSWIQSSFSRVNTPNYLIQFNVFVHLCVCWLPLCCLQVVSAPAAPRSPLDLKAKLNYTVQVRCSSVDRPPLWSDWSEPHHIYLDSKNQSFRQEADKTHKSVILYLCLNPAGASFLSNVNIFAQYSPALFLKTLEKLFESSRRATVSSRRSVTSWGFSEQLQGVHWIERKIRDKEIML